VVAAPIARLIAPLRSDPASAAVLCDVDGTLAPIVGDPDRASIPAETRDLLRELAQRYALVGCVTGRRAAEARRIVGVGELTYAGNHGLELLAPGAEDAVVEPAARDGARAVRELALELDGGSLRLEDKGPIQAFHWRGADDQQAAEQRAVEIASRAREVGLEAHWGRKVLELRPSSGIDKGTAVERLVSEARIHRALFGGDDRTDLDAFGALHALARAGGLRAAICVGVSSPEAPAGLDEQADAVVDGIEGFAGVLKALATKGAEAMGTEG
jgi:trehalose 6-phosphate phosphatase